LTAITSVILPPSLNVIALDAFPPGTVISRPVTYQPVTSQPTFTFQPTSLFVCTNAMLTLNMCCEPSEPLVKIAEDVTTIPFRAFQFCFTLKYVVLPSKLITIEQSAFSYTGLESIVIPNTVTTIGTFAFFFSLISTVDIPPSVISLADNAFTKGVIINRLTYQPTVSV
jgi:BspA type Leucine rich repeat region (6 copies)